MYHFRNFSMFVIIAIFMTYIVSGIPINRRSMRPFSSKALAADFISFMVLKSTYKKDVRFCSGENSTVALIVSVDDDSSVTNLWQCGKNNVSAREVAYDLLGLIGREFNWTTLCQITGHITCAVIYPFHKLEVHPCDFLTLYNSLQGIMIKKFEEKKFIISRVPILLKHGDNRRIHKLKITAASNKESLKFIWSWQIATSQRMQQLDTAIKTSTKSLKDYICHYEKAIYDGFTFDIQVDDTVKVSFGCVGSAFRRIKRMTLFHLKAQESAKISLEVALYSFLILFALIVIIGIIRTSWPGKRCL